LHFSREIIVEIKKKAKTVKNFYNGKTE